MTIVKKYSMISQFRRKYPQGSLFSELLSIKYGKYIVKVTVESEGKILATALAGAETVEEAEDRARERALGTMDWSESRSQPPPELNLSPPAPATPEVAIADLPITNQPTNKQQSLPIEDSEDFIFDTMAEISLQMDRLGWTKEQGKDYLLKTYGKKSRHLLSDEELMEFLQYLQSQPN